MSSTDWEPLIDTNECPYCKTVGEIEYRVKEDDEGHEDYQYHCKHCDRKWWIDGVDS